jgi:hypothetical protein
MLGETTNCGRWSQLNTYLPLNGQGDAQHYGWKRSPLSDKPSFGMVRGESPYYNRIIIFQAVSLFPQYREADF